MKNKFSEKLPFFQVSVMGWKFKEFREVEAGWEDNNRKDISKECPLILHGRIIDAEISLRGQSQHTVEAGGEEDTGEG